MRAVHAFEARMSALAETQRLRPPLVMRLSRDQCSFRRPGSKQLHGLGYAREVRLNRALEIIDLAQAPALHSLRIKPSHPDQNVDRAHKLACCECNFRSFDHASG